MSKNTTIQTAKKKLALIWFLIGGLLFIVMFLQTLFNYYDDKTKDAWSWFLPTVMPTLSLMIGVFITEESEGNIQDKPVSSFLYRLSFTLSIVYLVMVSLVILAKPLLPIQDPFEVMKISSLGLGPLQGLVVACIGVFFVRKPKAVP